MWFSKSGRKNLKLEIFWILKVNPQNVVLNIITEKLLKCCDDENVSKNGKLKHMWIQKLFKRLSCHKKKSFKNWYSWFVIQWLDKDLQCVPLALEHELFQSNIMKFVFLEKKMISLEYQFSNPLWKRWKQSGKNTENIQNENNI